MTRAAAEIRIGHLNEGISNALTRLSNAEWRRKNLQLEVDLAKAELDAAASLLWETAARDVVSIDEYLAFRQMAELHRSGLVNLQTDLHALLKEAEECRRYAEAARGEREHLRGLLSVSNVVSILQGGAWLTRRGTDAG